MRFRSHARRLIPLLVAVAALALTAASTASAATVQAIPLNTNNWSGSAGYGSTAPGWYEDSFGLVHLQGAAKQISTSVTPALQRVIGTLPPAARPDRDVFTIVHTFSGTYADVVIEPSGVVYAMGAAAPAATDLSFVSLEGIVYQPGGALPSTPIALNGANFSSNTLYGAAVGAPAVYTDGSGIVHLQGAVRQTSSSGSGASVIGSVPAADRPGYDVYEIVSTNDGTYADIDITAAGQIELIGPRSPMLQDYSFVSLEGLSYPKAYQTGAGIFMNTTNWSEDAGYDSRTPQWVEDDAGIIHLEGAVMQTSGGPNADILGTLPLIARPNRTIYTVAHTFFGTYADLAIGSNGVISVIGPRPPAVQDLRFLSLEGITYQQ